MINRIKDNDGCFTIDDIEYYDEVDFTWLPNELITNLTINTNTIIEFDWQKMINY